MSKKNKKNKTYTNKSATIMADNWEYIKDLPEDVMHTLKDGTQISVKEFAIQVNRELYANDAGKEGSIHKIELGDKFDKEVVGQNRWGKDITMKQEIYQEHKARQRDVLNVLGDSPFHKDTESLVSHIFEDGQEWVASPDNPDMNDIHNMLKHYTFEEIMTLHRKKVYNEILSLHPELKELIEEFALDKILLAYTKHIMLVSLKVKNTKNRLKNFKEPQHFQRKKVAKKKAPAKKKSTKKKVVRKKKTTIKKQA